MSLLEVRGLRKSFGPNQILRGVDLTVERGERIAIIGGSGCGKSVFLRCLTLLETPTSGRVLVDGRDITARGARVDEIRRGMGMVFQRFHLFSEMDVMDNLCLAPTHLLGTPRPDAEARALELLGQVGLLTHAHAWPATLSGGQQQRIAICRCLMMDPKLLLFDEPTSALDPTMVGEVLAVIRALAKRDMTMLIVTHEMGFAREVADRVLFFADGGIYEQGTPSEVFDRPRRPKTVAFIRKVKYFTFEVDSRHFDLMRLLGGIQAFGERYGLEPVRTHRLQICCEELVYEMLDSCYGEGDAVDMRLEIGHAEADGTTEIALSCGGAEYDPFSQEDDGLGVTIVKNMAVRIGYERIDGRNDITINL